MPEFTANAFGVSHGGALTTYVDIATTTAIYAFDAKSRTQVSAGLNMTFYLPAEMGKEFLLIAQIDKFGKGLVHSRADLMCVETERLICSGTHIKAFVDKEYML
jgi:acyl-coenzyme A thioesterase PaaI-like protein